MRVESTHENTRSQHTQKKCVKSRKFAYASHACLRTREHGKDDVTVAGKGGGMEFSARGKTLLLGCSALCCGAF